MGTGASSPSGVTPFDVSHQLRRSEADIVNLMMPVYFTEEAVTPTDLQRANAVWNMIIDDTAPNFIKLKLDNSNTYGTCVMYFYVS